MADKGKALRALKGFISPIGSDAAFSLEMRSRRGALIGGAIEIAELTDSVIKVCLVGGEKMVFSGSGLSCVSFGCRCVEISGRIKEIRFE